MCVSRRYVGRAVGVDAFEVSCLRPLMSPLFTPSSFTALPSRRGAQLAAPQRCATPRCRKPPSTRRAPRRRSTRPRRSHASSSSRTRPPSSRESTRSCRAIALLRLGARAGSRIYERVAENGELAHAPALGRANIGQDTRAAPSTRARRAARRAAPTWRRCSRTASGCRRRRRPTACATSGSRCRRGTASAIRTRRRTTSVAEHPRGVGDGPPPLRGGRAAARDRAHRGDAEPLLASAHAVELLLLPKNSARERGAELHTRRPASSPPRTHGRAASTRPPPTRPRRCGCRCRAARRCCRTRRSASRTPRSTPRSRQAPRSGCGSTPTRRCPSPTVTRFALLRRRRHGSAAAAGADELPGMMAPGVGWRASLMPPPAAGADLRGPGVAGWIEGVRWT